MVNNAYGARFSCPVSGAEDESLESQWRVWIEQEKTCRLSWSVYENDSAATFLYNSRPYIRLGKMRINMTCSNELWEAESAEAWATLRRQPNLYLEGPFFPDVMDDVIGTDNIGPASRITNHRHQRVMMLTLARMEWTLKDMRCYTPKHWIIRGFPRFQDEQRQVELALSFFEDMIRTNLKDPLCSTGLLQAARNLPIAHMSHLHSAGDLMDWLYLFLQTDERELRGAQIRRARWALEDPDRVRRVAFHCGQILGLSRRFPQAFPQQPFMIFHAGAALWCIAPMLNASQTEPTRLQGGGTSQDCILLDRLPEFETQGPLSDDHRDMTRSVMRNSLQNWLQGADREDEATLPPTVKIEGVEDVTSETGRLLVLSTAGELMQSCVSGISDKFQAIFDLVRTNPENWK